jgi:hypothetical protein
MGVLLDGGVPPTRTILCRNCVEDSDGELCKKMITKRRLMKMKNNVEFKAEAYDKEI